MLTAVWQDNCQMKFNIPGMLPWHALPYVVQSLIDSISLKLYENLKKLLLYIVFSYLTIISTRMLSSDCAHNVFLIYGVRLH